MPVPVHPDDRFSACQFCRQVFLARPVGEAEFSQPWESAVLRHEDVCPQRPVQPVTTSNSYTYTVRQFDPVLGF